MKEQNYNDVVTDELLKDTLDHNAHTGFLEDYRVLSCLLKIHRPATLFEIGTNIGSGINVMKTALPTLAIYSLDLDYYTMRKDSAQYPIGELGNDRVGSAAKYPYIQLRGDSMKFPYENYKCEAYFIDGEHDYSHPNYEAKQIITLQPKIIIFHDADILCVNDAILDAFQGSNYTLYRVLGTRIAYALKNDQ